MADLTDKPFGVNIAQAFVRDPDIVQFVVDQGVQFVTTSAGNPTKYTGQLKAAGLTVFHVVPTLHGALKAVEAGRRRAGRRRRRGRRIQEPARRRADGAAPADRLEGRRPDHRRRWHGRRCVDGGGAGARRRRHPDGDPDGVGSRVAGARELEAVDHRRRRDRHGVPQPAHVAVAASAAHRALRGARVRHGDQRDDGPGRLHAWTSTSVAT